MRGGEGVEVAELGPGDGDHLGGGVELHGAGAEGDHGAVEGEVAVGEAADVAEHLGLGVVLVEDGVGEDGAGALEVGGDGLGGFDAANAGTSGAKQDQRVSMRAGVVVSSSEMASLVSGPVVLWMWRRLMPAATAGWWICSVHLPVLTVMVSKKLSGSTVKPGRRGRPRVWR